MKFLNLAFIAVFGLTMIACGGKTKNTTHIEETESMELDDNDKNGIDDEDDIMEEDENEFLEAAMQALDAGNSKLAFENIMKAADSIKSYIGEMDDPENANKAIATLTELATKIKSGAKMSSNDLKDVLVKLDFFSEDDLDIDDDEIEDSSPDSE